MPCGQICKEIIDNRSALIRQLDCMSTSILLASSGSGPYPTREMVDEFKQQAEKLAKIAARIESHVNPGR